jgi:prepilin-type N-terminal cleavage/methylation domain-containing protein
MPSKKMNSIKKAFTLIELLVVVAIIGILTGIVIVNLNAARGKGQDTAIKGQMTQLRSTAELYYADNYGYSTANFGGNNNQDCISGSFANTFFSEQDVVKALQAIQRNSGLMPKCSMVGAISGSTLGAQSWVVTSKLRADVGFWCIDSSGSSRRVTNAVVAAPTADDAGVLTVSCPSV